MGTACCRALQELDTGEAESIMWERGAGETIALWQQKPGEVALAAGAELGREAHCRHPHWRRAVQRPFQGENTHQEANSLPPERPYDHSSPYLESLNSILIGKEHRFSRVQIHFHRAGKMDTFRTGRQ